MTQPKLEKPLEEMNKAELFAVADELQIPKRHDMTKAQLLAAVEEALTSPPGDVQPAGDGGEGATADPVIGDDPSFDGEPEPVTDADGEAGAPEDNAGALVSDTQPPEVGSNAALLKAQQLQETKDLETALLAEAAEREREVLRREALEREQAAELQAKAAAEREEARRVAHANGQLTDEDRLAIIRGSTDQLQAILEDKTIPDFVAVAVRAELAARVERAKLDEAKKLQRSPTKQYRITGGPPGMRYVTKESYVTTLPLGSIVTPLAHDLHHVQSQGFTWEVMQGVELAEDQLGKQVSTAK